MSRKTKRNSLSTPGQRGQMSQWFDHNRGLGLATGAWIAYTIFAVIAGVVLLVLGGLGTEHTDTKEKDAFGNVVRETEESKDSVPILAIYTALAAGGWLLIPLKFAWDEFEKNRDVERADRAKAADNAREIAGKMREIVFERITNYFGPMMYRQLAMSSRQFLCN
jgi:hypothetical protein